MANRQEAYIYKSGKMARLYCYLIYTASIHSKKEQSEGNRMIEMHENQSFWKIDVYRISVGYSESPGYFAPAYGFSPDLKGRKVWTP